MRKITSIVAVILAATFLIPSNSHAATPIAGAACTKAGLTSSTATKKFTCVKSGKKLVWDKGTTIATQAAAPGSSSTSGQINYFVATDQQTVHHLIANEGCANPTASTAEVQVSVGGKWLAVKPIKSGWETSPACPVASLGKKDSLAWVDIYLDPGVVFRWYFKGEINIEHHDNLGNGYSASQTLTIPTPTQSVAPAPVPTKNAAPAPAPKPTAAPVATTPEVGGACTTVGEFFDTPNVRYVCNLTADKKTWGIWTPPQQTQPAAPAPTPTQSAAPAPAPKPTLPPFKAKIPITLPVAPMGPITFANAASMYASIASQAWQNIQKEIAANAPVTVPITIYIGPNTKTTAEQMIPSINRQYQLLNGFSEPPTYHAVVFSAQDEKWGEAQAEKIARLLGWVPTNYVPLEGILSNVRNQCGFNNGVAEDCYGGNALGGFLATDGFSTYGVQSGGGYDAWTVQNQYSGPMTQVTHELTHNMQYAQFTGVALKPGENTRSDQFHHSSPCWFHEGQANAIGIPVFQPTLNDYLNARDGNIQRAINPGTTVSLTDFSAAGITAFLVGQDPLTCSNPSKNQDYQLGYSIGYAATEALIAIGGAQATIAILGKTAEGMTWDQAFNAVYGISWADGAKYLGQILAAEYAVKPLKKN